ncbi:MAG TPA: TadE family protein [Bryobacteraceae bacterium]|nr:TadE family protein [Bryobacteraceae bacterium]
MNRRGQATLEFVLAFGALLLPVTMMMIFTAKMMWVWHSVTDFTREGARYASTHCWQGGGENVRTWMTQNFPLTFDREQFTNGTAQIEISYFGTDPESGNLTEFSCSSGECTSACVPDTVRVRVLNYEFRSFFAYLGLPPVAMPDFQTTVGMESAGCNPDTTDCLP